MNRWYTHSTLFPLSGATGASRLQANHHRLCCMILCEQCRPVGLNTPVKSHTHVQQDAESCRNSQKNGGPGLSLRNMGGFLDLNECSPCADGVGVNDLSVVVLQQVAVASVQHSWGAHGQRGCVLAGLNSFTSSLHSNQADVSCKDTGVLSVPGACHMCADHSEV